MSETRRACLRALERKVLWLAVWMIHHANHLRPRRDGLKVGGHQASSASVSTLMTALYFDVLRPSDRVAVKPHASPVYHAIQYLLGRQTRTNLERFRSLGGAQAYPSRTKDVDDVDFSTGSVGLGAAITIFAALVQDYVRLKGLADGSQVLGRMVALQGDAEFDEGNVFEALYEASKHRIRNVWWIFDYNRQSLDAVIADGATRPIQSVFEAMDWRVITLKYGQELEAAFLKGGGDALRDWLDGCSNTLYSALVVQGGAAWRRELTRAIGDTAGIRQLLDEYDDAGLHRLMTNLGGHDFGSIHDAFARAQDDQPTCFVAYTIKGYGLPFIGHKDNHSGLMSPEQVAALRQSMGIAEGEEWDAFAGVDVPEPAIREFVAGSPFAGAPPRRFDAPLINIPERLTIPMSAEMSTQQGFGRWLVDVSRHYPQLASRIVTTSPDVTVSTNLGGWVNARGVFSRHAVPDMFRLRSITSAQQWSQSPDGHHIELGIAESNLFLLLAALGLSGPLFGTRLLPIGTVYDPFIARGLDQLNYACYQDARFLLVATPSGTTLAPEGGAHQSVYTPLIGIGQPGLTAFEPAYVDELLEIVRWSLEHLQSEKGGSVYLRLSTRPLAQPTREMSPELAHDVVEGGYWLTPPEPGAELAIVCCGPVVREAVAAYEAMVEDVPGLGVLVVTSPDRLHQGWLRCRRNGHGDAAVQPHVDALLSPLARDAGLITVVDAHPMTLSWLGSVRQHTVVPLGVEHFGQSGDIPALYAVNGIDTDAMISAAATILIGGLQAR
ncbi:MAG: transketolase [Acidobacteria bacterium RIFCSPLOWO2_12_FULL_67_14]|nr:MAG: transketolase [Acidobacteria bacterium RIFCSPLOWO2_02_FULL_67_21]OFW37864.1 MAG: transketolase [Acidobacteria bacterium RIFCSPLOWO2_12_FULL_67_14]